MADIEVSVQAVNLVELGQAMRDAPKETLTFLKQDFSRFGARFIKKFKRERLSGPPGIKGGPWARARDKNARAFASTSGPGEPLENLRVVAKLSRLLRPHETGATITPKKGQYLYLSKKTGKAGQGKIFARVTAVKIPARLGFVEMFKAESARDLVPRIPATLQRVFKMVFKRRMTQVASVLRAIDAA